MPEYQPPGLTINALHTEHQGFVLSRHSRDVQGRSEITLWLSTDEGPARLVVDDQQPVFFVPQSLQSRIEHVLNATNGDYRWQALSLVDFSETPMAGLYFNSLSSCYRAQKALSEAAIEFFEGDIRLHERYLMERFAQGSIRFIGNATPQENYTLFRDVRIRPCDYRPSLRLLSLDIECSQEGVLYSVGLYSDAVQRVLMIGPPQAADDYIHWCTDEVALLKALEQAFNEQDPDIVIGWNLVDFDFKLLLRRAEHHGLILRLGRGRQPATWRHSHRDSGHGFVSLPGRVALDGIDSLKTATYQFASFSLEFVAQTLLKRGKSVADVANRMEHIDRDFQHDKPRLATYNLEDCRLVWDIFKHTRVLEFLQFRSQLTGLALDRSGGYVAAFTHLYLPRLHRAGYIAPNLPADGGLASPGGYVMESRPGLYKHVLVLDFKSLYPSIIRTFKIDPLGLIEGLKHPQAAIEGFKQAKFSRQRHFLPAIITRLWQQRDQAKEQQDQPRSQAIKLLMNSFYGVLGSGGCRFYDTRLASSITLRGHQLMQQTTRYIEDQGYQVIYGDTDSLFVSLDGDCDNQRADELGQHLAQAINRYWQAELQQQFQLQSHLELEYETHFQRFFMPTIRGAETGSKKRYAGLITRNGEQHLVFKGLENVRTDWTELARTFQNSLYQLIFNDEDPTVLVRQTVQATLAGENDHLLIYSKRLRRKLAHYVKNVPPHVRAARLADQHNLALGKPLQYQRRGRIAYVITRQGPEPLEYHQSPIDYQHYIDKQLQPVADAILPFVGLSFEQLIDHQLGLF